MEKLHGSFRILGTLVALSALPSVLDRLKEETMHVCFSFPFIYVHSHPISALCNKGEYRTTSSTRLCIRRSLNGFFLRQVPSRWAYRSCAASPVLFELSYHLPQAALLYRFKSVYRVQSAYPGNTVMRARPAPGRIR
jgi:hypothetical protein